MKLLLGQIVAAAGDLRLLGEQKLKGKGRTVFQISQLLGDCQEKLNHYSVAHQALVKEYGEPTKEGGYKVFADKMEEFSKKMEELLSQEVDLLNSVKIKVEDLESIEMSGSQMLMLKPFLDNEDAAWNTTSDKVK